MKKLLAAACAFLVAGPVGADNPDVSKDPVERSVSAFGGDLFQALRAQRGNLFFSPYSVSVALAMTREGAAGETAAEMDATLRLPAGGPKDGFQRLARALVPEQVDTGRDERVAAYQLEVANALWGQEGYAFKPEYGKRLAEAYDALFAPVDFAASAAARERINSWVAEKTHDKIKDLLPENMPQPDTRLVLTNAVWFKAAWAEPFSERSTEDADFFTDDPATVRVRLMRKGGRFAYGETSRAQVIEIPYLGGGASMVVVLPKKKDGLADVETIESIDDWTGVLKGHTRVSLSLPKFTFTTFLDLTRTLQEMGMKRAFSSDAADFSGITAKEPLYIGIVLHKAFVAVDEKGTEAAAATAVGMRAGSAMQPEKPVEFRADHPFLFFLRHPKTGTVLFLGRVANPSTP